MTVQQSVALRTAQAATLEASLGASPKLQLRTGAQPADCATADSGTLLAELTLPSDALDDAASGAVAKLGTWTGVGVAAGTAAHWRLKTSAGTTHLQGSIGEGSGDLSLDNVVIAVDQVITITSFVATIAGA